MNKPVHVSTILVEGGYSFTKMPRVDWYPQGYIHVRNKKGDLIMTIRPSDLKEIVDTLCE